MTLLQCYGSFLAMPVLWVRSTRNLRVFLAPTLCASLHLKRLKGVTKVRVNQLKFAEYVGVSRQTVSRWIDAGMPAERKGKKGTEVAIPLPEALLWWREYMIRQRFGEHDRTDLQSEKIRLTRAQAEKTELEHQQITQELLPTGDVRNFLYGLAEIYCTQLNALPDDKLVKELAAMNDSGQIRQRLFEAGRAVREVTADKLDQYADSIGAAAGNETDPLV